MPEYRIVTKIDPAPAVQGAAQTKQALAGVSTAADQTGAAVTRMTAQEYKAVAAVEALARAFGGQTKAQKDAEAAALRVLKAVDQESLAIKRQNDLLRDATRALAAGKISADQYARVQNLVTQNVNRANVSIAQQRAGYTQLGFQVQDITQTMALGINPLVVLAQQGGQTASALSLALGEQGTAGKVATFMAGPWGSLILAATAVLGMMALRFLETKDAAEEAAAALKKDAEEAEINRQAKVAYNMTLEGTTEALRVNKQALDDQAEGWKTAARLALEAAIKQQLILKGIRNETAAQLDLAEALLQVQIARATGPTQQADMAALGLTRRQEAVDNLRKRLADVDRNIAEADQQFDRALRARVVERASQLSDPIEKIKDKYEGPQGLIALAQASATAEEARNGTLFRQVQILKAKQKAEEDAYRATQRANRATSDGVAKFRSREQAIGIAGRELQRMGLKVGENNQFGGVQGNHPGMGNAAHGRFAIDVDVEGSDSQPTAPSIRAKYDAQARLYQKRGYRVLWAGWVYEAGGNGPTRRIPSGQNQHFGHMHIEAPQTIVGKPTQSSLATELGQEMREGESKSDFVQGVVDKSAAVGLPDNRKAQLEGKIASTLADYERKFNEAPSPEERARIVGALTEAEAREQAERFREAYQYPLEDLQLTIGQTGLQREIYNRVLEETAEKGEPLTDQERQMIENSVRMTDVYQRQIAILERLNEPLEAYKQQIAALNGLLAQGLINQVQYNAQLAGLQGPARDLIGSMPADQIDPNSGLSYGDLSATLDENARYAQQQADLQTHRQMLLDMNINYNALEQAAKAEHEARLQAIEDRRRSTQIMAASNLFDSLANIAEAGLGKQNAIYKAMFVASKAFAIADAIIKIQKAMAEALALPFPANLPALAQVAALGASIVSNIQAVSLNLADGGIIRGPGGPRDDRIPVNASDGEFMVNAAATQRNRAVLEAINNGAVIQRQRQGSVQRVTQETSEGRSLAVSFGDVVVNAGNATAQDAEAIGQETKRAIRGVVLDIMADESRSGGRLTRTPQSVMTS